MWLPYSAVRKTRQWCGASDTVAHETATNPFSAILPTWRGPRIGICLPDQFILRGSPHAGTQPAGGDRSTISWLTQQGFGIPLLSAPIATPWTMLDAPRQAHTGGPGQVCLAPPTPSPGGWFDSGGIPPMPARPDPRARHVTLSTTPPARRRPVRCRDPLAPSEVFYPFK